MTGDAVYQFRMGRGWTQSKAAAWYGISLRQWRRIENGNCPVPQPLANRIAAARSIDRLARQGAPKR